MDNLAVLEGVGRRLNAESGAETATPALPPLFFLTDPERTPDPAAIARRLPAGAGLIYRHFGAATRVETAGALAALCRARGLILLIGADPALAAEVGADGVHWPERLAPGRRPAWGRIHTAAAHSGPALAWAANAGLDGALLSPVFVSRSASAGRPLGLQRAARLAQGAGLPVFALGGVNARTARRLTGLGFAGLAAVGAFA
jgi:thiamine-phosphate pyrophosphorylase